MGTNMCMHAWSMRTHTHLETQIQKQHKNQQLKATYYASNTKTKQPKLTIEISKQIIKQ